MKKPPLKVAHNQPNFFFSNGPAAQTAQKQKSRTTKSPLLQDWVFSSTGSLTIIAITHCAKKQLVFSKECFVKK